VIEGGTGWRVEPGEVNALAKASGKALDMDADAREKVADTAIANERQNFSKAAMCAKTIDVYNEVLQEKVSDSK